jgi:hypothetical protein
LFIGVAADAITTLFSSKSTGRFLELIRTIMQNLDTSSKTRWWSSSVLWGLKIETDFQHLSRLSSFDSFSSLSKCLQNRFYIGDWENPGSKQPPPSRSQQVFVALSVTVFWSHQHQFMRTRTPVLVVLIFYNLTTFWPILSSWDVRARQQPKHEPWVFQID